LDRVGYGESSNEVTTTVTISNGEGKVLLETTNTDNDDLPF
jgi:hypothetical protein